MTIRKSTYLIAVPAILLALTFLLSTRPYYNWDMFPYMALAVADSDVPFQKTHKRVYREAALELSAGDYHAISARQPVLRDSSAAFDAALRYYRIKPGFNVVVRGLQGMGMNLVAATYVPSLVSYFLLGCLLFWWLLKLISPLAASLIVLVLMTSPLMLDLSRYSSPDMLCALLILGGVVLLFQSFSIAGMVVLLLAVFVRPDSIILLSLISAALVMTGRLSWFSSLGFFLAGLLLTMVLFQPITLVQEFLLPTATPFAGSDQTVFITYLQGLRLGLGSMVHSHALILAGLAILALGIRHQHWRSALTDFNSLMLVSCLFSFDVRYFLHPVVEDRFYLPAYLIIILVVVQTLAEKLYPGRRTT